MTRHSALRLRVVSSLLASLWLAIAGITPSVAADPPDEPVLRIDIGEHSSATLGLAVSPDGKRVATASTDRTVRLWSLPALEPERSFHLPVGPGIEGAAFAVDFSPDGKFLATAGWTGTWSNGEAGPWCLYLIALDTGDMVRTITGLPTRVNHIAYSRDGRFMALALKIGGGIRVYRTDDYQLVFEDRDYKETSTFVEFDAAGRLASTSYDGKIRLYDPDFHLIATGEVPEHRKPDSLAFSPDGTRIAVAYSDPEIGDPLWPPAVDVLSAADLTVMFRPDLRGVDNGALWRIAWSADGKLLYAGGTWQKGGRYMVRRWADGGKGRPLDISAASSHVMRIRTLPSGGVVFTGEIASLGIIGANDKVVVERRGGLADYTEIGDQLALSPDGLTVQFAFEHGGGTPAYFSLPKRQLEAGAAPPDAKVAPAVTDHPSLDVRDWFWGYQPTLNGAPLTLEPHDYALSLSIAPDGKSLVLGTKRQIIRYDAKGKPLWSQRVPFNTHGVVISGDARIVVAALGDGTLRWYAMDTGTELLAVFPHRDGQRWVAWTPSGYYMASVGGDGLIGWQVNRGRDHLADYFSVSRFSGKYYRPDIVLRTLASLDEETAIREANAQGGHQEQTRAVAQLLPPVIEVFEPADGATIDNAELSLSYRVRAPSGEPIEQIEVRSDGRPLGIFPPPDLGPDGSATDTLRMIVPQRDSELLVFARNRFAASEPARVRLKWAGTATSDTTSQSHRLFVLSVGVSRYHDPKLELGFPSKDAGDFVAALQRQKGRAYTDVIPRVLTDKDATLANLRDGLMWLGKSVGPTDMGMIFLAGHGVDETDGYHYLPYDSELNALSDSTLPYTELLKGLKSISGYAVMFLDTCHAGASLGPAGHPPVDVIHLVSELSQPSNGVIVYASSSSEQYSLEADFWKNGAFTKAVVEGLDGAAEYRKRDYITSTMLETYVKERVKDLTASRQTPTVNMPLAVPDLLLAKVASP